MKILQIIPTYKPAYVYGGPVFSTSLLCENLAAAGHEVKMLTTTANGKAELQVRAGSTHTVDGVKVTYFQRYTKDHSHFAPGLMWEVFRDCKKYDVVHIHSWWNIPVMVSVLLCWLRGVKPVLSPRGTLSSFSFEKSNAGGKAIFHKYIGKFLLGKTVFHVTADAEKEEGKAINSDVFVLPNFIQLAGYDEIKSKEMPVTLSADRQVITLLFLSRIHPKKNLEGLIGALSKVDFDFKLKIAGRGEATYIDGLKKLAAEKNISEKIEWLGEVLGEKKFEVYANADLFVLPSHNENFANVVIESLSAGTPVMVSDMVGLHEYVSEKKLGWVCSTDTENISETLNSIFSKKEKLAEKSQKVAGVVREDFSPKKLVDKYIGKYTALKN